MISAVSVETIIYFELLCHICFLAKQYENQNLSNDKVLGLNLGNVIKDKKNNNLPIKSRLDQTRSDIVGSAFYNLNKNLEISYNFSYDRD